MSSSTASPVRSVLNAVDSSPESPEFRGPLLPNQAELGSKGVPCSCIARTNIRLVSSFADERMDKDAMLKALEEEEAGASGAAARPSKVAKKRKASTRAENEARRQRKKAGASTSGSQPKQTIEVGRAPTPPTQTTEELPKLPPVITIAEASSPSKKKGSGRVPPLDMFEYSLVVSSSRAVATRYLCHMAPDRDLDRLKGATDSEAMSHFAAQLTSAMAWGGEVVKRLTRAHRTVNDTRQSFDEAMGQHTELVSWLEELEAIRAQENRAAAAEKEALEAQLAAERVDRAAEEETIRSELDAALAKKSVVEVELEETKARAEEEARRLRNKAINAWDLNNGYSEEEHPTSFLDLKKALADMADAEEDEADITPPSSPKP
ncbi:hypothetical protein F511_22585 [Dorcoceras hygrometricum]|uniref:Uncharacterized protein n=1 Tax=Dorcoceras hygrometricum TaxID=472368 RepID=A0A2Z7AVZ7_9LAMI|nr:hypothetical protein F511_22585 [Dorcoceras hygrometricum]